VDDPTVAEREDEISQADKDEYYNFLNFVEDGKVLINTALWDMVPPTMTVGEYDDLTGDLFERIRDAWEKWAQQRSAKTGGVR
jgi:hypothetical protein